MLQTSDKYRDMNGTLVQRENMFPKNGVVDRNEASLQTRTTQI